MNRLLQFWLGLCLLRHVPQQLPPSLWLLGLSIVCYAVGSVMVMALSYGLATGVQLGLMELLLLSGYVAGLLSLAGKRERIQQTLSALTGAGTLLAVPALALTLVESAMDLQLAPLWLLLLLWNLLVTAHIMRHALSSSMLAGAGVAMLYVLASTQVIVTVFPQLASR